MSERHREALAHLLYGIKSDGGFLLLTGEVGTGKTTVSRCLLEQVPEDVDTAFILNPKLTSTELLATICDDLHLKCDKDASIKVLVDKLNEFLLDSHQQNRRTVVIIDEAQNLSVDVLEQLRLLTNLETNQRKLLQIILLGQPELLTLLARPELRQLSQRVTARFHLDALTHNEVVGYIQHRLGIAGAKGQLFPLKTVNRIYKITKGIPRLINLVCDRALLGTYVQNRLQVDVKTVNQAALEVLGSSQQNPRWKLPAVAASIIMLIAAGYFSQANTFVQDEPDNEPTAAATGPAPETQNQVADLSTQAAPPINKPDEQHPAEISSTNPEFSVFEGPVSFITGLVTPIAEIDSINSIQGYKLKNEVFAELFRLWGTEVVLGPGVDPCSVAASSGLQCLSRLGSLRDISHNNRPAIVYLPIEDEKGFFLVTDINDTSVSLAANSKTFQLEKDEFLYNWNGRYTMLWLTPPAYVGPSKPGDTGETIDWLYKHLSAIDDKSRTNTGKPFGDDLERKIKRFQMSVGLVPDGIVGVQTWIHLNNRYRTGIPTMHTDVKS